MRLRTRLCRAPPGATANGSQPGEQAGGWWSKQQQQQQHLAPGDSPFASAASAQDSSVQVQQQQRRLHQLQHTSPSLPCLMLRSPSSAVQAAAAASRSVGQLPLPPLFSQQLPLPLNSRGRLCFGPNGPPHGSASTHAFCTSPEHITKAGAKGAEALFPVQPHSALAGRAASGQPPFMLQHPNDCGSPPNRAGEAAWPHAQLLPHSAATGEAGSSPSGTPAGELAASSGSSRLRYSSSTLTHAGSSNLHPAQPVASSTGAGGAGDSQEQQQALLLPQASCASNATSELALASQAFTLQHCLSPTEQQQEQQQQLAARAGPQDLSAPINEVHRDHCTGDALHSAAGVGAARTPAPQPVPSAFSSSSSLELGKGMQASTLPAGGWEGMFMLRSLDNLVHPATPSNAGPAAPGAGVAGPHAEVPDAASLPLPRVTRPSTRTELTEALRRVSALVHPHMHPHIHSPPLTHTRVHARVRTHTHTHTHTQSINQSINQHTISTQTCTALRWSNLYGKAPPSLRLSSIPFFPVCASNSQAF